MTNLARNDKMSEEGSFGLSFAERLFGLIVLAMGLVAFFYTVTSFAALEAFTWFFGVLSLIVVVVGAILVTAKTE